MSYTLDYYPGEFQSCFLVVKTFETLYQEFKRPIQLKQQIYSIPTIGSDLSSLQHRYRGVDRGALQGTRAEELAKWLRDGTVDMSTAETASELAMFVFETRGHPEIRVVFGGFLYSLEDARDVYSLLSQPQKWEIIWVSRTEGNVKPPSFTSFLGFEPSDFYTSDHFSPLCDCMCFPRWHGTDPEGTLFAEYHARLNEHALFETPDDAAQFLHLYQAQSWSERGDYSILQVYALSDELQARLLSKPMWMLLDMDKRTTVRKSPDSAAFTTLPGVTWDIILRNYTRSQSVVAVMEITKLTGLSIADANPLIERLPKVLRLVYIGEKENLVKRLTNAGFDFQIEAYS